jgi:hypothetical protein
MTISIYPQWWKKHFLVAELGLAILLGVAFDVWLKWFGGGTSASHYLNGGRASIYGAIASIFGSLLGFVIASISIVMGFATSDRLAILRQSTHYAQLWKVFTSATRVLGFTTLISLGGLIFDKDAHPLGILLSLCVAGVILSVMRVARCIWVLENLIDVLLIPPNNKN